MGLLDRLFGGNKGGGISVESALQTLITVYDDPQARSDGGVGVTGPSAEEVRKVGRELAKAGGRERMLEVRELLRARQSWAVLNLEVIWASVPGYQE